MTTKIEFGGTWDFYTSDSHRQIVCCLKKILGPKKFKALKQANNLPKKFVYTKAFDWFYELRDAFNNLPEKDRKGWYLRSVGDDCVGLFIERKIKITCPRAATKIMSKPCWIIDGDDE